MTNPINRIYNENGIEIPLYMYSVYTAHPCSAKENKEVIFSIGTEFSDEFKCPFCKEVIIELID